MELKIGEKIAEYRKLKGYTQEQLAKALGIAESTLIRKVKNDAITMDEANKIIGILKIDDPSSVFFTQIVT